MSEYLAQNTRFAPPQTSLIVRLLVNRHTMNMAAAICSVSHKPPFASCISSNSVRSGNETSLKEVKYCKAMLVDSLCGLH